MFILKNFYIYIYICIFVTVAAAGTHVTGRLSGGWRTMATRSLPQGSADRLTDDQGKARPCQLLPPRLQPSVSLLSLSSFPVLGCAGCSAAVPVSSWTAAACCVGARSPTRYAGCSGHPGCCGYRGQWQMWQQFAGKPGEPIPDPIPELA